MNHPYTHAELIPFPGGGACPRGTAFPAGRAVPAGRAPQGRLAALVADERGASTAEYAIVTLAAVAFAGLLVAILRSDEVRGMLTDIIQRALSSA